MGGGNHCVIPSTVGELEFVFNLLFTRNRGIGFRKRIVFIKSRRIAVAILLLLIGFRKSLAKQVPS